jgi:hypothetical protein
MAAHATIDTATDEICFLLGPWQGVISGSKFRALLVVEYSPASKDACRGHYESRYQETTNEDIGEFMCAAVTGIF